MKLICYSFFLLTTVFSFSQSTVVDSLKQIVKTSNSDSLKVNALSDLCWEYRFVDQQQAVQYGLKGIFLARKNKLSFGEAKSLNDLSIIYIDMGKLDSAVVLLNQAKSIRLELNDELGVAAIYNKLGIIYEHQFKLEDALQQHLEALKIYEKLDIKPNIGFCKNNIGNTHFKLGNYQKALDIHFEALQIRTEIGDQYGIAGSHANIGNSFMYQGDSDNAIIHFEKAVQMYREMNRKAELAVSLNNLGAIYVQQQNYAQALPLLNEALEMRLELNDARGISSTKLLLGEIYTHQNQLGKAELYLRDALKQAKQSQFKNTEKSTYKALGNLYMQKNNVDSMYHYYSLYETELTQEYQTNLNQKVSELQTIYETEKKDKENERLARENAEQLAKRQASELKLQNRNKWIIGVSFGLVTSVSLLLLLLQYNKQKAKQKLQDSIDLEKEKGLRAIFQAQEIEKERISKDLHDGIGQQLSGLKLGWSHLSSQIHQSEQHNFNQLIQMTQILDKTATEVRDLAHQMMPKSLSELGLVVAIQDMVENTFKFSPIHYQFDSFGLDDIQFDNETSVTLYRVTQELINNVVKHAKATQVDVQLYQLNQQLQLIVQDNGVGLSQTDSKGHGLRNLKSRISLIHAQLDIETSNNGTLFRIRMPLLT